MNLGGMFSQLFFSLFSLFSGFVGFVLKAILLVMAIFVIAFCFACKIRRLPLRADDLRKPYIRFKWLDLARWMVVDALDRGHHQREFKEYGCTFFVGRQGSGKTASMVRYLETIKERYPKCLIVTNFGYYRADKVMDDWRDFLTIRNGEDGIVFAIDEIQSEYDSSKWADFPETLLSEISQQRKQRIKIVATAQFLARVAKPLREQAATVVVCRTMFGRLTLNKEYDALQYSLLIDHPASLGRKVKPLDRRSFVQSDAFRGCYDTYEKIERMKKLDFTPRSKRASSI